MPPLFESDFETLKQPFAANDSQVEGMLPIFEEDNNRDFLGKRLLKEPAMNPAKEFHHGKKSFENGGRKKNFEPFPKAPHFHEPLQTSRRNNQDLSQIPKPLPLLQDTKYASKNNNLISYLSVPNVKHQNQQRHLRPNKQQLLQDDMEDELPYKMTRHIHGTFSPCNETVNESDQRDKLYSEDRLFEPIHSTKSGETRGVSSLRQAINIILHKDNPPVLHEKYPTDNMKVAGYGFDTSQPEWNY